MGNIAQETQLRELSVIELSELVDTLSKAGIQRSKIYDYVAELTVEKIKKLTFSEISKFAAAFSRLDSGRGFTDVFHTIETYVINLQDFSNVSDEDLSQLTWAFANTQYGSSELYLILGLNSAKSIPTLPESIVVALVSQLLTREVYQADFFDAVGEYLIKNSNYLQLKSIANLLHALSFMRHYSPSVFDAVADEIRERPESEIKQDINSIYLLQESFGDMLHADSKLLHIFRKCFVSQFDKLSYDQICGVIRRQAELQQFEDMEWWNEFLKRLQQSTLPQKPQKVHLLHYTQQILHSCKITNVLIDALSEDVLQIAKKGWKRYIQSMHAQIPEGVLSVYDVLERSGYDVCLRPPLGAGQLLADIIIGNDVVIVVQSENDQKRGDSLENNLVEEDQQSSQKKLTALSYWKVKILESWGYRVLQIYLQEWRKMRHWSKKRKLIQSFINK
eukprot:TRINITY_DN3304_c0_g1_i8.p1 TRINITY_DN3304_c0_g1~~TRINITY_DN3304_c0_g1_i8.p1  ORF type:complete len:448 (-),score=55.89 TRINITY_DN3304_c0_g1_i8:47-1390(-)